MSSRDFELKLTCVLRVCSLSAGVCSGASGQCSGQAVSIWGFKQKTQNVMFMSFVFGD